jgi:hypothetical protein
LWQVVFVRQIAVGHAMLRPQIPNNSFKRNAAVQRPLNSSVEAVEKPLSDHHDIRRDGGFSF